MEPQQIILVLYLIVLIIFSFVNPRSALIFFFSTKFTVDIFWDYTVVYNLNILKITGALFPLLCVIYFFVKRPAISEHPFLKSLLVLFVLNCLATSWGILNSHFMFLPQPHSPLTVKHILDWNLRFLNLASAVLVVPFILNESKDRIAFLRAFLISTIVPCLISWYQLSSTSLRHMFASVSEPYSVSLFQRLNATYHDPGTLAIVMFTAVIISALLLFIEKSNTLKALYLLYAILCSIILYFTFSRTLWICVTSFLILFFLNQKKYKLFFATTAIALLILTLIPLTQKRFERELSWIENGKKMSNFKEIEKLGTGRIWLWNDARKHYLKMDIVSEMIGSGGSFGSHNQYIAWLLRNGFIGLTVWLLFTYKVGKLAWLKFKQDTTNREIAFVLSLFWIVTCMMNVFMQPWDNTTYSYFFWGAISLFLFQDNTSRKQL